MSKGNELISFTRRLLVAYEPSLSLSVPSFFSEAGQKFQNSTSYVSFAPKKAPFLTNFVLSAFLDFTRAQFRQSTRTAERQQSIGLTL
jgi:hypothetical protein